MIVGERQAKALMGGAQLEVSDDGEVVVDAGEECFSVLAGRGFLFLRCRLNFYFRGGKFVAIRFQEDG